MKIKLILAAIILLLLSYCSQPSLQFYNVPDQPWDETLGNHRAVLEVGQSCAALSLDIEWRRNDLKPEEKQFIIIGKENSDTIPNIFREVVSNERCQLVFGPVINAGTYHFYYLPYHVQENYGFYNKGYLPIEEKPSPQWVKDNALEDPAKRQALPVAVVKQIEARLVFDSFYPMEVTATASEKVTLNENFSSEYLIFPESREFPIRMKDEIPQKWIESGPANVFYGSAKKNEYYTFQLGIYACREDIQNLKVHFSDLKNGENGIPPTALTSFNTGGIDPYGLPFVKRVDVPLKNVQAIWIGVDVPAEIAKGTYSGVVTLKAENAQDQTVKVHLEVEDEYLADRGDNEPWRHSRLRWLNSTLGIDDNPTKQYQAILDNGEGTFHLSGKKIELNENILPTAIDVYGTSILDAPIAFVVETKKGIHTFDAPQNFQKIKEETGVLSASWKKNSANMRISATGTLEADGYFNYNMKLSATNDIGLEDVRLEIPMIKSVARYMMGMGLPGTVVPEWHEAKWQGPYDSFWLGNENGGIWCEMRGGPYHGPLLNLYRPPHPEPWFNENRGGFRIEKNSSSTKAIAYSGQRDMKAGEFIEFEWAFLITPVKEINYKSQFLDRYYHNGKNPTPSDEDLACGVKIVNLHHANAFNPHINYPFVAVDEMKNFVDKMHTKGQKVKIYYTIRELTNYTTELWALRSLGFEILGDGQGGGYPWLREHLVDGYRPQWYQYFEDKSADASIVNAPGDSRWYNYYIEGLAWLVRNVDIDGLYLDDVTYDRRIVKRIRKVLDNEKPGCLLDLHSNTGFSKGPATQYAEYFPFIDKIWFGESFKYDQMPPENWLVEVSGIPFGLMGDMLHGGGNRWLGMLFGMTVRHPWLTEGVICDPRPVWKIWDAFSIHESVLIGFWEENPIAATTHPDVKASTYLKEGSILISIGNFSDVKRKVNLNIDWKRTGLDKNSVHFVCPEVKDFQPAREFALEEIIEVEPRKGFLLFIK